MHTLSRYFDQIQGRDTFTDRSPPLETLKLWENLDRGLSCYYAPFEHVNPAAKLVIVGITPGRTQMNRALNTAAGWEPSEQSLEALLATVKQQGSLSGAMRVNIVNILNTLGIPKQFGISCSSELWSTAFHHVHFCSLLKYPIFIRGKDYNGTPHPFKVPELKALLMEEFVADINTLPADATIIPLGDFVAGVLGELEALGHLKQTLLRFEGDVVAPPHPSGANAEAIALFLSDPYPTKETYLDTMYATYCAKQHQRKQGTPQPEAKYKAARAMRWERIDRVRHAYGL